MESFTTEELFRSLPHQVRAVFESIPDGSVRYVNVENAPKQTVLAVRPPQMATPWTVKAVRAGDEVFIIDITNQYNLGDYLQFFVGEFVPGTLPLGT